MKFPSFPIITLLLALLTDGGLQAGQPIVFYAGGGSNTRFFDVKQLSNGSILVLGNGSNLDWLPDGTPLCELPADLPVSFGTTVTYLMHLSGDTRQILRVLRMPIGTSSFLRWIRTTSLPSEPTGDLLISGRASGGYFIGRLNANFVDGIPTGFSWLRSISAANGHESYQPWDVAADGAVVYGHGGEGSAMVGFLDSNGNPRVLPGLRASHWNGSAYVREVGASVPNAQFSSIRLPTDMQSWTDDELFAMTSDGNGGIRQGSWPIDIMVTRRFADNSPINEINGRLYGYNGYRAEGRHWIGAITIDRRSGDFHIGFNIKSIFWDASANKEQPDFEPAVIAYRANGNLKWWNRLYTEARDTTGDGQINVTLVSPPDQYIDGLAIDYAVPEGIEPQLLVAARCHGNNTSNFWSGNAIALNPGGIGFQNRFTGTEGNIHITWLGRLRGEDGNVLNATYLAGFFRTIIGGKGNWPTVTYPEPIHDGWPNHNSGWPDLTTTRIEQNSLRVAADGRVLMVGTGPRMVTTRNAFQKLPRRLGHNNPILNEGTCPWNHWARAYEPDLASLAYSSALTGQWTYPDGIDGNAVGASNTFLRAAFPVDGGMLVVGHHSNAAGTSAAGNAIPTAYEPDWGSSSFSGPTGIIAFFPFRETALPPRVPPVSAHAVDGGSSPGLSLTVPSQALRRYSVKRSADAIDWQDTDVSFIGTGQEIHWQVPQDWFTEGKPLLIRMAID